MSITELFSANYFINLAFIITFSYIISKLIKKYTFKKSDLPENTIKEQAIDLARNNQRIKAIKHLRYNLNMSLKDSVHFIDNYDKKESNTSELNEGLKKVIIDLASKGRKIEAIKIVRKRTGMDLKSAKEFVESIVN